MTAFRMLCLVVVVGCADRDPDTVEPAEVPDDQPASPAPLDVLAKLDRAGTTVQWVLPPGAPAGTAVVVITGRADHAPLIDLDTAERMRAVELYLALAVDSAIPERLAPYATAADLALVADPVKLTALRQRTTDRAAALAREIAAATPSTQVRAGSCTAGQVATARAVFGNGYTSSATCGDHLAFFDSFPDYWYCNGGDCEYGLGQVDGGSCPLSNPCDYARAEVHARAMRSNTGGNPVFNNNGHRIRGFAYNCEGNGSLTMSVRYGGGGWDAQIAVNPGFHSGVFWTGSGLLQARATAISLVANGNIWDGIAAGGATYEPVAYEITGNASANDRGIFCTDTQKSLDIVAASFPPNCGHGFVSWCNGFCGGCFD